MSKYKVHLDLMNAPLLKNTKIKKKSSHVLTHANHSAGLICILIPIARACVFFFFFNKRCRERTCMYVVRKKGMFDKAVQTQMHY